MTRVDRAAGTLTRRRRLAAGAIDAGSMLAALGAGLVLAVAWLLARSDLGRLDPSEADAVTAVSLLGATLPAWGAWVALRVRGDGATAGQRRVGLAVTCASEHAWPRLRRLVIHPLAVPLWLWFTALAALTPAPWLWLPTAFASAAVAATGVASLALLLVRPRALAVHDRIAHTQLVRRA